MEIIKLLSRKVTSISIPSMSIRGVPAFPHYCQYSVSSDFLIYDRLMGKEKKMKMEIFQIENVSHYLFIQYSLNKMHIQDFTQSESEWSLVCKQRCVVHCISKPGSLAWNDSRLGKLDFCKLSPVHNCSIIDISGNGALSWAVAWSLCYSWSRTLWWLKGHRNERYLIT